MSCDGNITGNPTGTLYLVRGEWLEGRRVITSLGPEKLGHAKLGNEEKGRVTSLCTIIIIGSFCFNIILWQEWRNHRHVENII